MRASASPAKLFKGLTEEVVGEDSVVIPNLQREHRGLSKLRLLQRENRLLLFKHHLFLHRTGMHLL